MQENTLDSEEIEPKPKPEPSNDIHKGSWLKSIVKNGKWYLIASLATKGMLFFLLPVYTRYLTPSEYGIFNTLLSIAQLLPIFISFSLDAAFGRFFHDYKNDKEKLSQLFSSVYWFVASVGLVMLILVLSSSFLWIEKVAEVPAYPYAFLAFLPPLFLQLGTLGIIFLKQSLQSKLTSIVEVLGTIINIAITLPLLIVWDLNIIARLWGYIGAAGFIYLFMTIYFIRKGILRLSFNKVLLKMALIYSIPLIPSVASRWINMLSDRLVIAVYIDQEAVGLYSLGANIAILLLVIQDAISQVLKPVSISGLVYDKERTKLKMADFSLVLWVIMLAASLGSFLFSKDVVTLFADSSYEGAYVYIPLLGFVYVLGSQYRIFNFIIQYHKKTWVITLATLLSAGGNLLFNLIFVPRFGAIAAPFATILASIVLLTVTMYHAQRLDRIELHWKKLATIFFIFILFLTIGFLLLFNAEVTLLNFVLKIVMFLVFVGLCIWIGDYYDRGLKYIKENIPI